MVSGRSCPSVRAFWRCYVELKQTPPSFAVCHQLRHLFCVLAERKPGPFFLPPCRLLTVEPYLNRKTCTFFRIPSPSPCLEVSSQPRGGCGGVGQHGTSLRRIPLPLHGASACRSALAGPSTAENLSLNYHICTDNPSVGNLSFIWPSALASVVTARLPIVFVETRRACAVSAVWQ